MQNNTFICNKLHHIHLIDTISKKNNLNFNVILSGIEVNDYGEYTSVIENNKLLNHFTSLKLETNTSKVLKYDKENISLFQKKLREKKITNTFFFVDTLVDNQFIINNISSENLILIEEGVGFYSNDLYSFKEWLRQNFIKKPLFLIKYGFLFKAKFIEQGGLNFHNYLFCRFPEIIPKNKIDDSITIKHFDFKDFEIKNDFSHYSLHYKKIAFFVGSNTTTLGEEITNEDQILKQVFKTLKDFGYHIFVKPHPIEGYEKYKKFPVEIIDDSSAVEEMIQSMKPDISLSFQSSALINIKNKNSIFLYKLRNIVTGFTKGIDNVLSVFPNAYAPKDKDDFFAILNNITIDEISSKNKDLYLSSLIKKFIDEQ